MVSSLTLAGRGFVPVFNTLLYIYTYYLVYLGMELQPLRVPVATSAAALLRQDQDAASRYGVHGRSDSEDECKLGALKE